MNIIKEMLNLPDTPSGKKKLNKLITKLGLGKKQKGDILKNVVNNELGGSSNSEYYYRIDTNAYVSSLPSYIVPSLHTFLDLITENAISHFVDQSGNDVRGIYYNIGAPDLTDEYSIRTIYAICISDSAPFGIGNPLFKGDLKKRFTNFMNSIRLQDPESVNEIEAVLLPFFDYVTEITKDEYYSLSSNKIIEYE